MFQIRLILLMLLVLGCSSTYTLWQLSYAFAAATAPVAPQQVSPPPKAPPLAQAPRVALVIGNNAYAKALKNAVQDAEDVAATLRTVGFRVTQRTNLDRKTMRQAIRDFGAALTPHSVGLFYFAGHGLQGTGGKNYLLPVGVTIASEADVEDEGVDVDLVLREMGRARNPLNILILDACRTNPFLGEYLAKQQGLARMEGPVGTLIAYATTPGAWAADGQGRNGVYTKHLLAAMTTPGLSLEQMFKQVRNAVREETHGRQIPWESSALTVEFAFVEAPPRPPVNTSRVLAAGGPQPPPSSAPRVTTASLTVRATAPRNHVVINGQAYGQTPVVLKVEPGSYAIEVHATGHPPWTETVRLASGEQRVVRAVFTKVVPSAVAPPPRVARVRVAQRSVPRRVVLARPQPAPPRQSSPAAVIADIPSTIFRTGQRLVGSGVTQVRRVWHKVFD